MIDKLDLNSLNITEERKSQLKQIFPEIFTENKIDFDKLRMALGDEIEESQERYEMNWAGKKDAFKQVQIPSKGTLRPCREESVNFDETENLYIEGDNLEVLKLLQKSYYGKIKMIYIDPPYNTGNDFVYKDNFKDNLQNYLELTGQVDGEGKRISANQETAGRYHSNWLNMMYPRLFLARNLLKDDGVIFISIDDNEEHNLRKICDEIFGEENFIANVVRRRRQSQANLSENISPIHEYLLIYGKSDNSYLNRVDAIINEKDFKNPDNDYRGPYVTMPCTNKGGSKYEVITPTGITINEEWRFKKETYNKLLSENKLVFPRDGDGKPRYKLFLNEKREMGVIANTWWDDVSSNQEATKEIKDLFNDEIVFDTPKPTEFLEKILQLGTKKDDLVLDFFSGSASLAHAVFKYNIKNQYRIKFILVQLPEKCENNKYLSIAEIGKERIRRAGLKVSEVIKSKDMQLKLGDKSKNHKIDTGFKVLKLDSSNFKEWDNKPNNLEQQLFNLKENIKEERTQDDILYEIILKSGLSLSEKIEIKEIQNKKVYSIMNGFLIITLEKELNLDFIKAIAELKPAKIVCLDIGFKNNDQLKTNAVQIMKSIKFDGENSIEFKTV